MPYQIAPRRRHDKNPDPQVMEKKQDSPARFNSDEAIPQEERSPDLLDIHQPPPSQEVLFDGMPEEEIADYVRGLYPMAHIYMEAYRTRSAWNSDPEMQAGIARIKKAAPRVEIVTNMGVKKVVTNELMKLLGVYTFAQKSHHQDLRSAARIGLMGALKVEPFNRALYKIATKKLEGGAA